LDDARKRGVTIRILVESDVTDHKSVKYASRDAYDDMLERGIQIYEYGPTMMHTKTMVVDGVLNIFGSANFDNRSLELNDEVTSPSSAVGWRSGSFRISTTTCACRRSCHSRRGAIGR
jgi:cardiolipin synthase